MAELLLDHGATFSLGDPLQMARDRELVEMEGLVIRILTECDAG
jgi:hypothetical protein